MRRRSVSPPKPTKKPTVLRPPPPPPKKATLQDILTAAVSNKELNDKVKDSLRGRLCEAHEEISSLKIEVYSERRRFEWYVLKEVYHQDGQLRWSVDLGTDRILRKRIDLVPAFEYVDQVRLAIDAALKDESL